MNLQQKVEKIRTRLVKLGMEKGFQDPRVIKLSQSLDRLVKQYYDQTPGRESGKPI